jgi:hypothetical protein
MKTKNIILYVALLLMGMASCAKDPVIPTGKVFGTADDGGGANETYTISVSANPANGGTVRGGGPYVEGTQCTVTAEANEGYTFVNWTESGNQISSEKAYTFTVTVGRSLVANFTNQSYVITAEVDPDNSGTVTGVGGYNYGDECVLTATANDGYDFVKWTKGSTWVTDTAVCRFTVTETATYVAHFQIKSYSVSVSANPTNGGMVSGGGDYEYNQSCTVTATPNTNSHYHFVNWTENGTEVSQNASYTFNVTRNCNLVANFELDSYLITVNASPANGGTVQINNGTAGSTATGNFAHGTTIQLKATANSGYNFSQWSDGGAQTHNVTVTADATYTATFTAQPQAPTGALPGKFTINANGDKVYFSKGNLQYNKTTNEWSFMEHQYDIVETLNQNVGENYANQNIISLFGWGTSGYHDSSDSYNVNYQPWSTSAATVNETYNNFGYGPSTNMPSPNLTGSSANYDWGVYNPISNGGSQSGQWRTLTGWTDNNDTGEWDYVFNGRTTSSGILYAKAQVNGVNGVILLPDDWSASYYSLSSTNAPGAGYTSNTITDTQWNTLEQHGAVFLPAAGYRDGTSVDFVGSVGNYWSASYYNSLSAHNVTFYGSNLGTNYLSTSRCSGRSVRLVCPAEN